MKARFKYTGQDNFKFFCFLFIHHKSWPVCVRNRVLEEIGKMEGRENPLDTAFAVLYNGRRPEATIYYSTLAEALGMSDANIKFADWFWRQSEPRIQKAICSAVQRWLDAYNMRYPSIDKPETAYDA